MAFNRRLFFWLIKAYIKKWRKTIFLCFCFGLIFFFFIQYFLSFLLPRIPLVQKERIGVDGAYTVDTLPPFITQQISHGFTKLDSNGIPQPDLATSWDIRDNGKTYVFHLKKNVYFSDGTPFTSQQVQLKFAEVQIQRPDNYTMIFHLRDTFAPFLVTAARPIFKDTFVGIGDYKLADVKVNGTFITSLTLLNVKNIYQIRQYDFYPTQESLLLAFVLGDVSEIQGATSLHFKNTSLSTFPNAKVTKSTDYHQLVTLFYDTQDKTLSDKLLRDALSYALPNSFPQGEKATSSIPPSSWAYSVESARVQDTDHAKLLLDTVKKDTKEDVPELTISTLPRYKVVAQEVAKSWKQIGVKTTIKVVNGLPNTFQIFLGDFNVPLDPDQYTLWHSSQQNNITGYKSLRIDKLLEDGRKTDDIPTRTKIYADFQKYLADDQPASFLYFPYVYTVARR